MTATSDAWPLVVDLDGTLTPTDTLWESLLTLARRSPLRMLCLPLWLLRGRAAFKHQVAAAGPLATEHLPVNERLFIFLQAEHAAGRRIVLATAAHRSIAEPIAARLGLFSLVLASEEGNNLKGRAKLAAITQAVGPDFVYAGDSRADLPIWQAARAAVLVNVSNGVRRELGSTVPVEREFKAPDGGWRTWARALRVHQWLKNSLLFVPLLTAFSVDDGVRWQALAVAFAAFCLAASATYIGNDLWDLENDRGHPRKRQRPFAAAALPIPQGLAAAAVLLVLAFALASQASTAFVWVLLLYLVATTAYSLRLKEYVLVDVVMLSLLYTLRIIAGAVAVNIVVSSWLLAFSAFAFLSLALVKRCSELVTMADLGRSESRGRDYRVGDLAVLWPLGVGASMAAVVVFGLFISTPETQARYASPQLLWGVAVTLVYWMGRMWIKTSRGEMHDDPLVYAVKDRASRYALTFMLLTVLAAQWFRMVPTA